MRLVLIISIVALHVASSEDSENDLSNPLPHSYDSSNWTLWRNQYNLNIVTGDNAENFTGQFSKEVASIFPGDLVFSPVGAWSVLSMLAYGARGSTVGSMKRALHLSFSLWLEGKGFRRLTDSLNSYEQVELHLANKIFLASNIAPKAIFTAAAARNFRSEVQTIDFGNFDEASGIINAWCEQRTNYRMKDIVGPGDFNADTQIMLLSVLYFKGTWLRSFEVENTVQRLFYVNNETQKKVSTMHSFAAYNHGEYPEVDARFVELPYKSEDSKHNISMFVILPNRKNGLSRLESNVDKITLHELIRRGKKTRIHVLLPKFKIQSTISLREPLEKIGLSEIFTNAADFSGIVHHRGLKVGKIVQKAFIEIDEKGSEAAVSPGSDVISRMLDDSPWFIADHPFIAIIATRKYNSINILTLRYSGQ